MTFPTMPSIAARQNIADEICDMLRDSILSGNLAPGMALNQGVLAQQLKASTTPVREALLKLTAEGFIRAEPHRAFRVVRISRQDVEDVFWLHGQVAAELAVRTWRERRDALAEDLESVHTQYVAAVERDDVERVIELNWKFHQLLNAAVDGARLRWTLRALLRLTPSTFYREHRDWVQKSVKSHAAIAQAVRKGQVGRLRTAVLAHIASARTDFTDYLESIKYWDADEAESP
jgi:DNA-binding GntR family transcriptional regulator